MKGSEQGTCTTGLLVACSGVAYCTGWAENVYKQSIKDIHTYIMADGLQHTHAVLYMQTHTQQVMNVFWVQGWYIVPAGGTAMGVGNAGGGWVPGVCRRARISAAMGS